MGKGQQQLISEFTQTSAHGRTSLRSGPVDGVHDVRVDLRLDLGLAQVPQQRVHPLIRRHLRQGRQLQAGRNRIPSMCTTTGEQI